MHLTVHPDSGVAVSLNSSEDTFMFSLSSSNYRSQYRQPGADFVSRNPIHNAVHRLAGDLPAANRAVRNSDSRIKQSQIVINLGNGSHRRTWVLVGGFLVNGNSRRKALDYLHIRLFHQSQKLSGISRQAFHVFLLAFGIYGIKSQR